MVKKLEKVDVVTVGVGWTGGIVAAELTKAGYKVVGLERGEDRGTKDYFHAHDELKYTFRKEMMMNLSEDTITFRNDMDQTANPVRDQANNVQGMNVGGAGSHWAAQTHRYFSYDFEIRSKTIERYGKEKISKDMTIQNWGITYDEIEPYYDKIERTMGTSGEVDPLADKRSNPYPNPPLKKLDSMKLFEEATKNLGYHPYVIPTGIVSENYENPDGQKLNACQYCAFCNEYGCEHDAKANPVLTVIPTAQKTGNYELRTHSKVKRILYKKDKAVGVLYEDTITGEEFEQPADIIALTAFTLNNIRLLLLSEIGTPYDPKTGKGIIGKNFTTHGVSNPISMTGFFEQKFNLYAATGAHGMTFEGFNADNFDHSDKDFIHGGHIEVRLFGNAPIENNLVPEGTPSWGKEFKDKSIYYYNRTLSFVSQQVITPTKDNYADLDPIYTDENGDPLLRITYDYNDNDRKVSEFLAGKGKEVLEEMGADIIDIGKYPEHYTPSFIAEHCGGGAIMGESPEESAVNNYSQMWDMENLFIFGATVFPHFGSTNPTLTLGALAYRASEGMIEYLEHDSGQLVNNEISKRNV